MATKIIEEAKKEIAIFLIEKYNKTSEDGEYCEEDIELEIQEWNEPVDLAIQKGIELEKEQHHSEGFLHGTSCKKCHELVEYTRKTLLKEMMSKHKIPKGLKITPENMTITSEKMFSFSESYAEMRLEAERKRIKEIINKEHLFADKVYEFKACVLGEIDKKGND